MQWRLAGLSRARDNIQSQLSDLVKQKPRNKDDDDLISEMTRLEAILQVSRDDLVCRTHPIIPVSSFLSQLL
jgi:hypothetical protein